MYMSTTPQGTWRIIGIDKEGHVHDLEPKNTYHDATEALRGAQAWTSGGVEPPTLCMTLKDGTYEDVPIVEIALELMPRDTGIPELWKVDDVQRFLEDRPVKVLDEFLRKRMR